MDVEEFKNNIDFILTTNSNFEEKLPDGFLKAVWLVFKYGYSTNWTWFDDLKIYRGRINKRREPFTSLTEVWYPPKEFLKFGRANLITEPVFYGASMEPAAISELRPEKGDYVVTFLAKWTKEKAIVKTISGSNSFPERIELSTLHRLFEDFIFKVFTTPVRKDKHYFTSGALANLFFKFSTEALMYPSFASKGKAANFAFPAEFADNFIIPHSFRCYEVIETVSEYDIRIRCTHYSQTLLENKEIVWGIVAECEGHHITWETLPEIKH